VHSIVIEIVILLLASWRKQSFHIFVLSNGSEKQFTDIGGDALVNAIIAQKKGKPAMFAP